MKSGTNPKKILRVSALVLADILSVNLAAFLSLYSRFEFSMSALIQSGYLDQLARFAVLGTVSTLIVFYLMRLYSSVWEYASTAELVRIGGAAFLSTLIYWTGASMMEVRIPRSFPLLYLLFLGVLLSLTRMGYRYMRMRLHGSRADRKKRTMVIGAGAAGAMVIREFNYSEKSENKPVCILDDDPAKVGTFLRGVRVVGTTAQIVEMAEKHRIEEIVFAIPSADRAKRAQILEAGRATGCNLMLLQSPLRQERSMQWV